MPLSFRIIFGSLLYHHPTYFCHCACQVSSYVYSCSCSSFSYDYSSTTTTNHHHLCFSTGTDRGDFYGSRHIL
jgi:hypothetical protein